MWPRLARGDLLSRDRARQRRWEPEPAETTTVDPPPKPDSEDRLHRPVTPRVLGERPAGGVEQRSNDPAEAQTCENLGVGVQMSVDGEPRGRHRARDQRTGNERSTSGGARWIAGQPAPGTTHLHASPSSDYFAKSVRRSARGLAVWHGVLAPGKRVWMVLVSPLPASVPIP